jgi:hypothetical protein
VAGLAASPSVLPLLLCNYKPVGISEKQKSNVEVSVIILESHHGMKCPP